LASVMIVSGTIFVPPPLPYAAAAAQRPVSSARAYCISHPNYTGPGEQTRRELPADVRSLGYGAAYWRCRRGQAWVCDGGASGFNCAQTVPMDADRMRALREVCSQAPGIPYIGRSVTVGLASSWRCNGRTPVMTSRIPVDEAGFIVANWKPLH